MENQNTGVFLFILFLGVSQGFFWAQEENTALQKAIKDLQSNEDRVCYLALDYISAMGPKKAEKAFYSIVQILQNPFRDVSLRITALSTLEKIELDPKKNLSIYLRMLNDNDREVVKAVVKALGKLEIEREKIAPALAKLLSKYQYHVEIFCTITIALGNLGETAKSSLPYLMEMHEKLNPKKGTSQPYYYGDSDDIRKAFVVAFAISKISPDQVESKAYLRNNFEKLFQSNIDASTKMLGQVIQNDPEMRAFIIQQLNTTKNENLQYVLITSLGFAGSGTRDTINFLEQQLLSSNENIRLIAAWALGMSASPSANSFLPLSKAIFHFKPSVNFWAVWAVGKLGASLDEDSVLGVIPILKQAMKNDDKRASSWSAWSLGRLEIKDKIILAKIWEELDSEDKKQKFLEGLNERLWRTYEQDKQNIEIEQALGYLSCSKNPLYLDTIAVLYAWKKNEEKALEFAKKALPETLQRVELILKEKRKPSKTEKQ